MRIKIKGNAYEIERGKDCRPRLWLTKIRELAGTWLDVETEYLFKDQYNTAAGRIMADIVERVEGDARIGRVYCTYCHKHSENPALIDGLISIKEDEILSKAACLHCKQSGYLFPLDTPTLAEPEESEFDKQAREFLDAAGITFKAKFIGSRIKKYWEDGQTRDVFRATFRRSGTKQQISFEFGQSLNKSSCTGEFPSSAYDVLSCMEKYEPDASFTQWCIEYGYNTDSRKAEKVYKAVKKEWRKVSSFFTAAEIEELREIN